MPAFGRSGANKKWQVLDPEKRYLDFLWKLRGGFIILSQGDVPTLEFISDEYVEDSDAGF